MKLVAAALVASISEVDTLIIQHLLPCSSFSPPCRSLFSASLRSWKAFVACFRLLRLLRLRRQGSGARARSRRSASACSSARAWTAVRYEGLCTRPGRGV